MTPKELNRSEWTYLQTVGVIRDPPNIPALYVQGVHGGCDFAVGLLINGHTVSRLPNESWDELLTRVRCNMVLRGDPNNEAVTLYSPHVAPKAIRNIQPRFRQRMRGW